jgi:hypothetical protein
LFAQRFFALLNNEESGVSGAVAVCFGLNQFFAIVQPLLALFKK